MKKSSGRGISRAFATAAVLVGVAAATVGVAAPAQAVTSRCGSWTCTVYLDRAETQALGAGRVPNLNLGAYTVPYRALAYTHVWFAKAWAARGYCVAFQLSLKPWESQGMLGWRCQ